jgi:hypothetical protein
MSTPKEINRRAFCNRVGVAILTVQCLPLMAHPAAISSDGNEADNDLIIHSGPGAFGHVHDLAVPYTVLRTPPREGVELTSSQAFLHTHRIALSQKELATVSQGGTVSKRGSSHLFVITLATRKGLVRS